jgi:hypothetical protein
MALPAAQGKDLGGTMSDQVTQWEIYHEARNHLRLVLPILERIAARGSQENEGYVTGGAFGVPEAFTEMGWRTVELATSSAGQSASYLHGVQDKTVMGQDAEFLNNVQELLALTWCTLAGMTPDADTPPGVSLPWAVAGLLRLAENLYEGSQGLDFTTRQFPTQEKEVAHA